MPRSLTDPFFIAEQAKFAALKANRSPDDMEYLRAFYKESSADLDDCRIASATYLAWHQALTTSGVRFEEHVAKLGLQGCNLNQELRDQFEQGRKDATRARVAQAIEDEQRDRELLLAGGGGVAALVAVTAWVLLRRRSQARNAGSQGRTSDA